MLLPIFYQILFGKKSKNDCKNLKFLTAMLIPAKLQKFLQKKKTKL